MVFIHKQLNRVIEAVTASDAAEDSDSNSDYIKCW